METNSVPEPNNFVNYWCSTARSGGGGDRFMAATTAYHMSELGKFGNGGGVSLTLALQHCDGAGLHTHGVAHHGVVTMRGDDVYSASASSTGPEAANLDCIDPGNQQQPRFSSSHLLHDFVA